MKEMLYENPALSCRGSKELSRRRSEVSFQLLQLQSPLLFTSSNNLISSLWKALSCYGNEYSININRIKPNRILLP